jgi:CRISPR type IV-associated protein Csf1
MNGESAATDCCAATALIKRPSGDGVCFYCGSPAELPLVLSSSFTDWYNVAQPASKVICNGCAWMLDEKRTIAGKDKPQKTRNYGWFIREGREPEVVTKGTKDRIRKILLNPPPPRWALALPVSGQKHLLHRTPVNRSTDRHAVAMETDVIWYTVPQLQSRIELVEKVVAAIGHKGAADLTESTAIALGVQLLSEWLPVRDCPVTSLALYVTPNQKECQERCQPQLPPKSFGKDLRDSPILPPEKTSTAKIMDRSQPNLL